MPIVIGIFDKMKLKLASYGKARDANKRIKKMAADLDEVADEAMLRANNGKASTSGGSGMEVGTAHLRKVTAQEIYEADLRKKVNDRQYVARGYEQFRKVADLFNPAAPERGHVVSAAEWKKVFAIGGILDDMISLVEEQGLEPVLYFITYPGNKTLKRVECVYDDGEPQIIWLDASAS